MGWTTDVLVHVNVSPAGLPHFTTDYAFHPHIKRLRLRSRCEASRLDAASALEMGWDKSSTLRRL